MPKSILKGGDRALGSMDDAFYLAEVWNRKMGQKIGEELGMTPKQIRKRNILLKTVKELESKGHFTHSPLQRTIRMMGEFKKTSPLDMKLSTLKKRLSKYPQN